MRIRQQLLRLPCDCVADDARLLAHIRMHTIGFWLWSNFIEHSLSSQNRLISVHLPILLNEEEVIVGFFFFKNHLCKDTNHHHAPSTTSSGQIFLGPGRYLITVCAEQQKSRVCSFCEESLITVVFFMLTLLIVCYRFFCAIANFFV